MQSGGNKMGRDAYLRHMRERLQHLGFDIERLRAKLTASESDAVRVRLRGELEQLEMRRDELRNKLRGLQQEPEGAWSDLRAQWEEEWDALVQDFEERFARLG